MNKMRSVFATVSMMLLAYTASAVSTIPVPISEDEPLRLGASVSTSAGFSSFSFKRLDGILGVGYGFGGGFEGGFQFRAGGVSKGVLFQAGSTTNTVIGGDMVLRYLGNVTGSFYLGLQGRVGYDYTFNQSTITTASNVTAGVGVPLGMTFGAVSVYAMPEIDFGRRLNDAEGVFGSSVGLGGAIGTYISFGMISTYLEVKPKTINISDSASSNFAMDATLGLALEI